MKKFARDERLKLAHRYQCNKSVQRQCTSKILLHDIDSGEVSKMDMDKTFHRDPSRLKNLKLTVGLASNAGIRHKGTRVLRSIGLCKFL